MTVSTKETSTPLSRDPSPFSSRAAVALILIVLGTLAALWPVLQCDFVVRDDDYTVSQNPLLKPPSVRGVFRYWTWPAWGLYTPVTYTVWSAVALLSPPPTLPTQPYNLNPTTFHATNLTFHVLGTIVVWLILRRLLRDNWAACAGALLYGVHPVQVEPVAWVSGLKDVLAAFFALVAVWQYVSAIDDSLDEPTTETTNPPWRNPHYLLCLTAAILAVLSKVSAAMVPGILVAIDWFVYRRPPRAIVRSVLPVFLCVLPAMIGAKIIQHPEALIAFWQRPILVLYTISFYLSKIAWPVALAPDYARPPQLVMKSQWIWACWIIPLFGAAMLWLLRRRYPAVLAGAAIFLITIFPVSGIFPFGYQGESSVSDHYLYLAMFGIALAAVSLLVKRSSRIAWSLVAVVIVALAARSHQQAWHWRDTLTLFTHTTKVQPHSFRAENLVGYALLVDNKPVEAEPHLRRAMELDWDKNSPLPFLNLGRSLMRQGRLDEAITTYRTGIRVAPKYAMTYLALAEAYLRTDQPAEAEAVAKRALEMIPVEDPNCAIAQRLFDDARRRQGKR